MALLSPGELGQRVARKRGSMGIRAAAQEIGTSPATLSRIEHGHLPDSRTLGKICLWLGIDPGLVIGGASVSGADRSLPAVQMGFKKGDAFSDQTAKSLANLIIAAHSEFVKKIASEEP
jgi:transcriptional regulator with XRE-family HTH domain